MLHRQWRVTDAADEFLKLLNRRVCFSSVRLSWRRWLRLVGKQVWTRTDPLFDRMRRPASTNASVEPTKPISLTGAQFLPLPAPTRRRRGALSSQKKIPRRSRRSSTHGRILGLLGLDLVRLADPKHVVAPYQHLAKGA